MNNKEVALLTIFALLACIFFVTSIIYIIIASELVGQIPTDNGKVIIEKE